MQEFISMATKQLGISESAAKGATTGMLGMLQKNLGAGEFSQLTDMLPGASDLLKGAAPAASSGGGIAGALGGMLSGNKGAGGGGLGNIAAMATSALSGGKDTGGLASILGMLASSGLTPDKAGGFAKLFMSYIQGKGGGNILQGLTGKIPDLKGLL